MKCTHDTCDSEATDYLSWVSRQGGVFDTVILAPWVERTTWKQARQVSLCLALLSVFLKRLFGSWCEPERS